MHEKLFATTPAAERLQMLQDNADSIEDGSYFKNATETELDEARRSITALAIKRHAINERKKELMAEIKEELKPLNEEYTETLDLLQHKGRKIKERLFKFVDQETNMVGFYNANGDLVEQRRALPNEKQTTITRAINQ